MIHVFSDTNDKHTKMSSLIPSHAFAMRSPALNVAIIFLKVIHKLMYIERKFWIFRNNYALPIP